MPPPHDRIALAQVNPTVGDLAGNAAKVRLATERARAAGASLVAAHHNPRLVPVAILMALLGYAMGTYGGFLAAWLCQQLS